MGAGCIIKNEQGEILALINNENLYDLPKGHEDPEDIDAFETAQRETWEECGIWVEEYDIIDQFKHSALTLFIIEWDGSSTPEIKPNPATGQTEHTGWEWVTPAEFSHNCLEYLVQYIEKYETIMPL